MTTDRLNKAHHGFRVGRSTTTNLVSMVEYMLQRIAGSGQVDALYFDLAKAFDKVDHDILLRKLHNSGVGHNIVKWLRRYLL